MKKKTIPIANDLVLLSKGLDMSRSCEMLLGLKSGRYAQLGNDNGNGSDSALGKRNESSLLCFSTFSFLFRPISKL